MPSSGGQESMNRPSKDASRQLQQHQQRRQEEWNKDGPESLLRAIPLAGQALSAGPTPLLISSMIDLREVCRLSLLCRATREAYGRRSRKACLTKGVGVPDDRRLEYWKCVLNVQKEIADKTAAARNRGVTGDLYESFLFGGDETKPDTEPDSETEVHLVHEAARPWTESNTRVVEAAMLPPSGLGVLSRRGVEGEISRDVGRTFPNQRLFRSKSGPGQNMLANVLKAYIKSNPDVGYCQGMNFVAGSLLLACSTRDPAVAEGPRGVTGNSGRFSDGGGGDTGGNCGGASGARGDDERDVIDAVMESELPWDEDLEGSGEDEKQEWRSSQAHLRAEKDVFWLMMALTSRLSGVGSGLGMRELWLPGVPQLKVRVFQFDKLLLQELPRLYNHFRAKQLQLEVLVSQWFLTLFSYSLRPPMLLRVLDLTFTDGWKAMFRFGLARLRSVENTLCELELEGVSRFLRGFREPDSPLPSPSRDRERLTWYQRHFRGGGEGGRSLPWNGPRNGSRNCSRGNAATAMGPSGLSAASIRVLRATGELKVTRSTLGQLQKDFAVQLLKEHLQGEGQWLTRYGSAPEPSPGTGAGVVGGAADGDVGFMGVEAMTRMMLSDAKLLGKLKEDLAGMAAPLQADAQIFRSKITDASERHEGATRLKASLMAKLINLKEEIEALGERKKLVSDQMHLLLVQFEQDSAREHEEQQQEMYQRRRRRRQQEGKSSTTLRQSDGCLSEGLGDSNGSSRSSSRSSIAANGVRVSPTSSSDGVGSIGGTFGPSASFGAATGGGKLSFDTEGWQAAEVGRGPEGSNNGSGGGRNLVNDVDVGRGGVHGSGARGEIRNGVEGRGKEGSGDDKAALPWIAFPPPSPPPQQPFCPPPYEAPCEASCEIARQPAKPEAGEGARATVVAKVAAAAAAAAGAPRGWQAREEKAYPRVDDARGSRGKTPRFRPVVSMMSSGALPGAGGVAPGRRDANALGIARKNADGDDDEEEDPEGTAWKRLAKWVGGGTGKPRSQWFATRVGMGVDSSSAPTAMAVGRRSRASLSSPPKTRSGNRRQRRSSLPEGNKRQPTLMEELYEDLGELRRRLEHLQNGIDEKSDMYATLSGRFGRAMVEAEEAHELKRALSEQMLQLLLEQEQRLESYLREWVNFGDDGPGYLAPPTPTLGKGSDHRSDEGGGGVAEQLREQGVGAGGGKRGGMVPGVSSSGGAAAAVVGIVAAGVSGEVSRGVSWGEGGGVLEAFPPRCSPDHRVSTTAATAIVMEREGGGEERDGFENVESWVEGGGAGVVAAGAGEVLGKDAIGISSRGQGGEVGVVTSRTETKEEAGALLVPFPSSYEYCS